MEVKTKPKKDYKYKFSVIIPIYNVEDYLEETILSVVHQTIGIKNIQMILVNDGSPDNSEAICLKYKEMYPNNVLYIKKENGGVSSARNLGMQYIEGKYVNFLDSDDKWEKNAYKKIYKFFEAHYNEIDLVGVKIKTFEASTANHPLNYKFDRDKVIDIFKDFDCIQLHGPSTIIKASALLESKLKFNEKLKYSEDACFMLEMALNKEKVGLIASTNYLYRKRWSDNSALQTKNKSEDWYLKTPTLCHQYLIRLSKEKYGYVLPYLMYFIMYEYKYRMREAIPNNISQEVIDKYLSITKEIFKDIDEKIILSQRGMAPEYMIQTLLFKQCNVFDHLTFDEQALLYHELPLISFSSRNLLKLNAMNFQEDKLDLIGFVNCYLPKKDYKINIVINNKKRIELKTIETNNGEKKFFGKPFMTNQGFHITVPIQNLESIHFEFIYKNKHTAILNFNTGNNAKIDSKFKSYYVYKNQLYYYHDNKIKVIKNHFLNRMRFSLRMYIDLLTKRKFKVMIFRLAYSFLKLFKRKEIWLVSDRANVASDNGMHMFQYIVNQKDKKIKPYFVIEKSSKDYLKMKKIGKILDYNSIKYKLYFLLSDKIISSQADAWVTNAFNRNSQYYHDLYNYKFVFLQHGITKDDISGWLNIYDKNIRLFVTSAKKEYDSILNDRYGYTSNEVKLTGLPRYDNLSNESQKLIAFMPTWRHYLSGKTDAATGKRLYNPMFNKSEYFQFYNKLINDKELLKEMKAKGYTGIFVIHPSHMENYRDFEENDLIKVVHGFADYQDIFNKASLLISDYSSVPFDFAYLRKPVIYTQFDRKFFFEKHSYKEGYFSYEDNGFGPVKYDYDSTVKEIMHYIKNDCKLEKKYLTRIESFYQYNDRNNCKRVYEEIKKIK